MPHIVVNSFFTVFLFTGEPSETPKKGAKSRTPSPLRKEGDLQQEGPLMNGLPLPTYLVMRWVSHSDLSTIHFPLKE